jgi:hypothetical protein
VVQVSIVDQPKSKSSGLCWLGHPSHLLNLLRVLRQLHLPLLGAWALTRSRFPWAGSGDLTTHHVTDCISHPTQIRTLRVQQPSVGPNWVPREPARSRSYMITYLSTAGCGSLWIPQAVSWPMELVVNALLPRSIRQYYDVFCFCHKNFGHNRFSTLFFSMKVAESEKIVLASCIIDFEDIQV